MDEALITLLGYEVINFKTPEIQARAKTEGMAPFKPLVESASVLFFRPCANGKIGCGVAQEIEWAQKRGIPVLELPVNIKTRTLDRPATRTANQLPQRYK
jgi:hypothetical protein